MRLVLAIPTTGRPQILTRTLRDIARQTRLPDFVVLSIAGRGDLEEKALRDLPFPCMVVTGEKGASVQRNRAIEVLGPNDILLLLDDDFVMASDFVAQTEHLFAANADIVLATGNVLADGIRGPGIGFDQALDRLDSVQGGEAEAGLADTYNGYGCNMAVRARPVLEHRLRFDERLPLYSWLEDVDFSRRLAAHGRIVRAKALRGVHLGTKTGRTAGIRQGYSQIANPVYLMRKGTMAPRRALRLMGRNLLANLAHAPRPEPWVDRRGRLRGNLLAMADLLRRQSRPERILDFG